MDFLTPFFIYFGNHFLLEFMVEKDGIYNITIKQLKHVFKYFNNNERLL